MGRPLWPLALVVTFALGVVAGAMVWRGQESPPEQTVSNLQQQVTALQARLRAWESSPAPHQPGEAPRPAVPQGIPGGGRRSSDRFAAAAATEELMLADSQARGRGAGPSGSPAAGASSRPESRPAVAPAPTVEAALDSFYRYLEAMNGLEGRERWKRMRELVDELRGMADVGAQALMQVLAAGTDSDERRAAARLLGTLQAPQALPLLRDIIQREDDLLLRRAAAAGLRQLQTADSVPVMERILVNPAEDRFVRLSAASGLAESGKPLGVSGLAQIFEESTADGRGRAMAFRALASLNDERPLPFMRQVATSQAEPSYRLQAIRYLASQGDRNALGSLQMVMQSPNEQPSIRDAAAQAYRAISSR